VFAVIRDAYAYTRRLLPAFGRAPPAAAVCNRQSGLLQGSKLTGKVMHNRAELGVRFLGKGLKEGVVSPLSTSYRRSGRREIRPPRVLVHSGFFGWAQLSSCVTVYTPWPISITRSSAIAGRPRDAKACQGLLKWTWKWQLRLKWPSNVLQGHQM